MSLYQINLLMPKVRYMRQGRVFLASGLLRRAIIILVIFILIYSPESFRGTFLLNEHTGEVFAMLFQVIEAVSIFDNVVEIFI